MFCRVSVGACYRSTWVLVAHLSVGPLPVAQCMLRVPAMDLDLMIRFGVCRHGAVCAAGERVCARIRCRRRDCSRTSRGLHGVRLHQRQLLRDAADTRAPTVHVRDNVPGQVQRHRADYVRIVLVPGRACVGRSVAVSSDRRRVVLERGGDRLAGGVMSPPQL